MKKKLVLIVLLALFMSACTTDKHDHNATDDSTSAEKYTCPMHPQIVQDKPGTCSICGMDLVKITGGGGNTSQLMLSESQVILANITTSKVKRQDLSEETSIHATLAVDETKGEVVTTRVSGRIEQLYVKENGISVTRGQPLYELYSEQLMALQQEYILSFRQNEELGRSQPRYEQLLDASRKKLALYGVTDAQISQLAKSGKPKERITYYAKASGFVSALSVTEGQYVQEGQVLLSLENTSSLWLEAQLFPGESAGVKPGDQVSYQVDGFGSSTEKATVSFLSPEFKNGSQILIMRAVISNPDGKYKPGMQARVNMESGGTKVLAVPLEAVIRNGQGSHVYVLTDVNTFEPRMVKTGEENSRLIELIGGIKEGEEIAFSGAYLLYSEMVLKKGIDPSHHQH